MDVQGDGSCLVCGRTVGPGGWDALIARFNADGSMAWVNSYGGGGDDALFMIKSTPDGNFVASGLINGNGLFALKIDGGGSIIWQNTFGVGAGNAGRGVTILSDGYVFSGYSGATPLPFHVKTDANGAPQWAFTGVLNGITAEGVERSNGEIWFGAGVNGDGGLLKYNSAGNILSTTTCGTGSPEALYFIKPFGTGYLMSDQTWGASGGSRSDPWLRKLDNNGNVLWSKVYNFGVNLRANAEPTNDGGALFAPYFFGVLQPNGKVVKVNSNGDILWARQHTFIGSSTGQIFHIKETPDGGILGVGFATASGSGTDIFLIKMNSQGEVIDCCPAVSSVTVQVYAPSITSVSLGSSSSSQSQNSPNVTAQSLSSTEINQCSGTPCCVTNAGSIQNVAQNLCISEPAVFVHNGNQVLDGDDLLQFVLSASPNITTNIITTVNAPEITYNSATMQIGVTYYFAAIAGNNSGGNVSLSDPCLDISNVVSLIWKPLPAVSFSVANPDMCTGNCRTVAVNFTGIPPFNLTYSTSLGTVTQNFPSNAGNIQVCAPIGTPPGPLVLQATLLTDAQCTCQ